MAEIPVERKGGGIPGWVWLLIAAIIVALLIWWATADDDEAVVTEPVAAEQTEPMGTENAFMTDETATAPAAE